MPPVDADAEQLHQLLYELLTNGVHATPSGGSMHLRGELVKVQDGGALPLPGGDYVRLSVRDEGVGIPEPQLARIFEPFFTTKENARGLGLATCFLIARNHDGFMTVDSAPNYGTTFFLYLPALPASRSVAPAPAPPGNPAGQAAGDARARTGHRRDARPLRRKRAAHARDGRRGADLRGRGGIAQCARVSSWKRRPTARKRSASTRRRARAGKAFDAVILDLTVRDGMGGRETVLRLKHLDPDVRAIVSSGYSQDPMMSRYRDYGFRGSGRQTLQRVRTAFRGSSRRSTRRNRAFWLWVQPRGPFRSAKGAHRP